jgi:hypothetical protein
MVRRRSTVRFRNGAQLDDLIRKYSNGSWAPVGTNGYPRGHRRPRPAPLPQGHAYSSEDVRAARQTPSAFVTREPSAGPARTYNGTVKHGSAPDRSSPDGPSTQARGRSRAVPRARPPVPGRRPGLAMGVKPQVMAMLVPCPHLGGPGAGEPGDRVSPRPRSRRDRAGRTTMTAVGAVAARVLAAAAAASGQCRVPVSYLRVRMTCSRLAPAWPSAWPISCRHIRACSCGPARGGPGPVPRPGTGQLGTIPFAIYVTSTMASTGVGQSRRAVPSRAGSPG